MIDESRLNLDFRQSLLSCVLSSYGIVANYFTGQAITDFFQAYCLHFNLPYQNWQQAEQIYANHFDKEWKTRRCRGYEIIVDLHQNSRIPAFIECRAWFNARFIMNSEEEIGNLEKTLQDQAAFLNMTYESGTNYHSVTIFHNGRVLRVRDTNTNLLRDVDSLSSLGKLRDSVLYSKKYECPNNMRRRSK